MRWNFGALVLAACAGGRGPEAVPAKPTTVVVTPAEPKPSAERDEPAAPPEPARAKNECQPSEAEDTLTKAKKLFQEGVELYERGEYGAAGAAFGESYELSCSAQVLYNIGKAREQLGDHVGAIEMYERYLQRSSPDAPFVDTTKLHIEQLRKKL